MSHPFTAHDVLPSEVAFVSAMEHLGGFGRLEFPRIENGEPVLDPWPTAVR